MHRRAFLAASLAAAAPPPPTRPNIVFVIADDLRHDALAATGSKIAQTPNLDRLAAEGARFSNFFCATPLCSPSRASFLTGLYPHSHRVINNDKTGLTEISHTLMTWPRLLRESGYETAFIGKWHMGLDDSRRPGFDHWVSFKGQGIYIDPVVNYNGESRQLRGYMTDYLNQEAAAFVRRKHSRPFVLYVSHKAVHIPYLPAPRHDKLYAGLPPFQLTPPPPGDLEGKPMLTRKIGQRIDTLRIEGATPEPAESRRGRPRTPDAVFKDQLRCLASVDEGIGMLRQALAATAQLDNTVFIFTGDNGYLMGEHGLFDNKRVAYEPSIRIPFLLRYPKLVKPGAVFDHLTLNIDVMPTMLELARITWPDKLHGRSFLPLLKDPQAPWRDSFFCEYFQEKAGIRFPDWQAVRTRHWKYIHYTTLENMDELYHLAEDPAELRNRIHDPAAASTLHELRQLLRQHLQD
ncbi:MAG: sulfatase [Bryobacterales bacterium]|nr:sulfatase [Bryobacterales bacterium]